MGLSPARAAALEVTRSIREREGYAPEVLNTHLRRARLSEADARFATALSYGVVETAGTLDEIIDRIVGDPSRVEDAVRDVLRLGVYELVFMRKPDHVVVDQTVELTKRAARRATGFTNAVMRRIAREVSGFPWGDPQADDAALAREAGFPLWLVTRLITESDRATAERFLAAHRRPAPLYVAVNRFLTDDPSAFAALEAAGAVPSWCGVDGCIVVEDAPAALASDAVVRGEVLVADAAAQFIAATIAASAPDGGSVLEIGSGRGTKTALIQSGRATRGRIGPLSALDSHAFKVGILDTRMKELRIPEVVGVVGDARSLDDVVGLPPSFEVVSVDAPCSGIGTLRRHPDKRWRVCPDDVSALAALGRSLLTEAATRVGPGGTLFYSTCTVLSEENEEVIESFLASEEGAGFRREPFATEVPQAFSQSMMGDGYFRTHPEPAGPDGHFAARLVRAAVDITSDSTEVE